MKLFLRFLFLLTFIFSTQVDGIFAQAGWAKSYKHGIVVTADEHASKIGRKILQQGGNAIDAAVAVQFALAVTLPRAGNIGGGGFMVLHMQDGTTTALDFREKAPERATENMYVRNGEYQPKLSREGALAVGVPGVVDGMIKAIERYGRLPLETVIRPAIELANQGYHLSWIQARDLNAKAEILKTYKSSRRYFLKSNGEKWQEGDLFIQKDLAQTLERIANLGRDGFYSGKTADLIINEMKRHNGLIGYSDLRNYESKWRDPIQSSFMGYDLHIMPPPSSGSIAVYQILEMLEPYNLKELGFNSAKYIHLLTETMRRAFADRAYFLGDPDFVDIPKEQLMDERYNRDRMDSFSWDQATSSNELDHGDISSYIEPTETTHFSIVDENGNAVSVTTTLNGFFGSKLAVGGAGFVLNNEMDDFTAQPGEPNMYGLIQGQANAIRPKKRMLSSMTPTIVTQRDSVRMVIGAAGGPRIISATLQNFLNLAVFKMEPHQAISVPRIHHQWKPDKLFYEPLGLSPDTKTTLRSLGHDLGIEDPIGRVHSIYIDNDGLRYGTPDPRFDGTAEGY